MTTLEKITKLNWVNHLANLKTILKELINMASAPTSTHTVYTALIRQTGVNAPTPTILENTIGNIVWTAEDQGLLKGTLVGAFPADKTIISPFNPEPFTNIIWLPIRAYNPSVEEGYLTTIIEPDAIYIYTINESGVPTNFSDLFDAAAFPLKVEVYP